MVKQKTGVKANTLFTADNLYILNGMNSESVDLIYLDPPFNSKRMYEAPVGSKAAGSAFKDMWTRSDVDEAYLENLFTKYPFTLFLLGGYHSRSTATKRVKYNITFFATGFYYSV